MTTLSTHVLDAALGQPASGIGVTLDLAAAATTDQDGRIRFGEPLSPGRHTLRFATGPWFADQGRDTFFPEVDITFDADPDQEHYHVALLLSPFAYTTYRGS